MKLFFIKILIHNIFLKDASGVVLAIPMPGHGLSDAENVTQLEELIGAHDVIFFLTDSRESRWLPTLISSSQQKV